MNVNRLAALFVMSVLVGSGCASNKPHRIPVHELATKWEIIGDLGYPLGWVVSIEAIVVDGRTTRDKLFGGVYLLDILKINGRTLPVPKRVSFSGDKYCFPNNQFDRYEQVNGKPSPPLSPLVIEGVNKGYVGNTFDLLVYETGRFTGPRTDMVPEGMSMQGESYGFKTFVVVMKVLDP